MPTHEDANGVVVHLVADQLVVTRNSGRVTSLALCAVGRLVRGLQAHPDIRRVRLEGPGRTTHLQTDDSRRGVLGSELSQLLVVSGTPGRAVTVRFGHGCPLCG